MNLGEWGHGIVNYYRLISALTAQDMVVLRWRDSGKYSIFSCPMPHFNCIQVS